MALKFRSTDAETTGLPSDDGTGPPSGVMQLGWCDYVVGQPIGAPESVFVDCGIECTVEARAVHHITDEMIAGELTPTEASRILIDDDFDFMCAHNVDHEKHYLGTGFKPGTEEMRPWLCSYKTAFRLWPDAPGHKLHELRYYLKLDDQQDFDPKLCEKPHRAPDDAYVGAHLTRRVLQEAETQKVDIDRLVKWSSGPALLVMCWMKKHKGKTWSQVARDDRKYLLWIYNESDIKDRDIRATVKYWLKKTEVGELSRAAAPDDPHSRGTAQ